MVYAHFTVQIFLSFTSLPLLFCLQYAVMQADGTPLYGIRRQITIHRTVRSVSGRTNVEELKRIVPDDGIVHYQFFTEEDGQMITVRV